MPLLSVSLSSSSSFSVVLFCWLFDKFTHQYEDEKDGDMIMMIIWNIYRHFFIEWFVVHFQFHLTSLNAQVSFLALAEDLLRFGQQQRSYFLSQRFCCAAEDDKHGAILKAR